MYKFGLIAVLVLAVACGDDESTENNATNNSTNNVTNDSTTNNVSNNATNNSTTTNNVTNNETNNETTNVLPDPFVSQLTYRRVATENCQLSGCIKSESINFISDTFANQDGRTVILSDEDGNYQALNVEAQRESFIANLKASDFACSDSVSPVGTTFEFEAFVREDGKSNTYRADITGCVIDEEQDVKLVLGLFADLKTEHLP